jgi:DNA-binding SARP family transcriptional activator/energy-coupling factor transporter ATP-binding protein EcfA2
MANLQLTCFNTFQVTRNGEPVTRWHSVKTRALLVYLVVEQASPHQRDVLAGLLWPDLSEQRARRNLSQNIMELRRAIGDSAAGTTEETLNDITFFNSDTHTISFNPASNHWVDVLAFAAQLAILDGHHVNDHRTQIHSDADASRCPTCGAALQQAAALYTGPFLAGFSVNDSDLFENWLMTQREYYLRRAVEVLGRLSIYYEHQGDLQQAQMVVRQLLDLAPWQEEAHRQLMRLLALQGRRTDALAQYDVCCQALEDELGIPPSAETNTLYDQILSGAFTPEARLSATRPSATKIPLATTPAILQVPFQAQAPPPHFVTRAAESAQLMARLTQGKGPILAVVGMGGAGKTTLAAHMAHVLRANFNDGVLWANALTSAPQDTLLAWGRAYGFDFDGLTDLESRSAAVRSLLADKRALIVIDNVTDAAQVRPLLPGSDSCALLLTTRDLDVAHALNAHAVLLGELSTERAGQLLVQILGEERVQVEAASAAEICLLLHGLPLALEIVAQRLKSRPRMKLSAMAMRLHNEQHRLGLEISDQAVRTSFMVSWKALDETLRRVFALLALFEGRPFRMEAVAHIADLDEVDAEEHLFALTALSLLNEEREVGYFRQHALLADFAKEQLTQVDEAYKRMWAYYLGFVQDQKENTICLEPEWGNIMSAIAASHRLQNWEEVIAFTDALSKTWLSRGQYRAARQAYAWAQDASKQLQDVERQATNLLRWGEVCLEQSDYQEAKALLTQGMLLAYELEEGRRIAEAQVHLARIATEQSDYAEAWRLLEESKAIRQELGDAVGVATVLFLQARYHYDYGPNYNEAERLGKQALAVFEEAKEWEKSIPVLQLLAQTAREKGQLASALHYGERGKRVCEETQNAAELAATLYVLLIIYRSQGDYAMAREMAVQSLQLVRHLGIQRIEGMVLHQLSILAFQDGENSKAFLLAEESGGIFRRLQDQLGYAYSLRHQGDIQQRQHNAEAATATWLVAKQIAVALKHEILLQTIEERLVTQRTQPA